MALGANQTPFSASEMRWRVEFAAPYRDPTGLITRYALGTLDECADKFYSDTKYYAPFLPIVQSSGWGKSRLMKHLASKGILVFYFCLLDDYSSGYPRADPDIAVVFRAIRREEDAYAIFYACLMWLIEQESMPDAAEFFLQQETRQWPEGLKQKINRRENISKGRMQAAFEDVWEKLAGNTDLRHNVRILFAVDEARHLIDPLKEGGDMPFTLFRRASSAFREGEDPTSRAMVVVIDTSGKVSNIAPTPGCDSSSRVAMRGKHLFNPMSAIPTFNLHKTPQTVQTLEEAAAPLTLFCRGRPLWAAALSQDEHTLVDLKVYNLMMLAITKLTSGEEVGKFLKDGMSSLVVLGRRIAVDICPQDRVAEHLVASHMQVCLDTSPSRECMLTTTLPEPVLAAAAVSTLEYKRSTRVARQLQQLHECILNGQVSAEERGELLVARFLLLNTIDELNGSKTKPLSLEAFLRRLTKNAWPGFGGRDAACMKAAQVFFNAFYPYYGWDPAVATLKDFIENAGALVCRQELPAYDLLIPFVTPSSSGEHDLSNEECVQCLGIQVNKNREDIRNSHTILEQMCDHTFRVLQSGRGVVPTILLVLQFGEFGSRAGCYYVEKENQRWIAMEGLDAVHHDAAWKERLEALLWERPHPMSFLSGEEGEVERDCVRDFLKQLYDPRELTLSRK